MTRSLEEIQADKKALAEEEKQALFNSHTALSFSYFQTEMLEIC